MKTEDFNRLKEICEKEGFEAFECYAEETWVVQKKKDTWHGVEFINRKTTEWPICKISKIDNEIIYYYNSEFSEVHWNKKDLLPSTEQAYIEQLKNEAFERFGEIKSGDRFENPNGGKDTRVNDPDWSYNKRYDWLYYGGCMLYKQGKWAVKIDKRIEVKTSSTPIWKQNEFNGYDFNFWFRSINGGQNVNTRKVHDFLAKKLEKYLNS